MIEKHNIPTYSVSWLRCDHATGIIGTFYEPETKEELIELCRFLYKEGKQFDLIGHTSNIYFLPDYSVDIMVSTRRVRNVEVHEDCIVADCGASVSKLSRQMVNEGVKGFEGLIDLPGTVAASVYGNASCYGCSINALLESFELLRPDGEIVVMKPEDLKLSKRSSALKRGEIGGVILSATLRRQNGEAACLQQLAEKIHNNRIETQPGPKDNLGSIYYNSGEWSIFSILPRAITFAYGLMLKITGFNKEQIREKKKSVLLIVLGGKEIIPYFYGWNRYIWRDENSHRQFWKYHRLHRLMFKHSTFEIEIKGESPT